MTAAEERAMLYNPYKCVQYYVRNTNNEYARMESWSIYSLLHTKAQRVRQYSSLCDGVPGNYKRLPPKLKVHMYMYVWKFGLKSK